MSAVPKSTVPETHGDREVFGLRPGSGVGVMPDVHFRAVQDVLPTSTISPDRVYSQIFSPAPTRCLGNAGDRLEFKVSGGIINIIPKLPTAGDEHTPAQRREIDAQLAIARNGPFHGPFDSADDMISHRKGELKKRVATKRTNKLLSGILR